MEASEIQDKKQQRKINKSRGWFFEKNSKIGKPLATSIGKIEASKGIKFTLLKSGMRQVTLLSTLQK